MALPDPVIIIPGVTASYLQDEYLLPPESIWTVLNLRYERSALHPDNLRYEAGEPSLVRTGQIYEVSYKELLETLRHDLASDPTKAAPVFPFAYDWRQPLEATEDTLNAFIKEVIARTLLMTHYVRDGYKDRQTVTLIGHSMGGLIAADYLTRYRTESRVKKVVTLATPFRGSFEAVIKVTTGTANLGTTAPSTAEREAARLTPALYYLIPDVPDGLTVQNPAWPKSLFDPKLWQPSVLSTITTYVQNHGTNPNNVAGQATALFDGLLKAAEAHRARVSSFRLHDAGLEVNDWLCVVGVDSTTRVRLEIVDQGGDPDFRFHSTDRDNQWGSSNQADRVFTGDGTVPFEGAVPTFLSKDNLVCVTPGDYGYWEVQDQLFTSIAGFHGILPNMDMVQRLIVRHLTGAPDTHDNTWGRRAPGVTTWAPPLALKEK